MMLLASAIEFTDALVRPRGAASTAAESKSGCHLALFASSDRQLFALKMEPTARHLPALQLHYQLFGADHQTPHHRRCLNCD